MLSVTAAVVSVILDVHAFFHLIQIISEIQSRPREVCLNGQDHRPSTIDAILFSAVIRPVRLEQPSLSKSKWHADQFMLWVSGWQSSKNLVRWSDPNDRSLPLTSPPSGVRDWDYPDMAYEAGTKALKDAGISYKEIGQAVVGYCYGTDFAFAPSLVLIG